MADISFRDRPEIRALAQVKTFEDALAWIASLPPAAEYRGATGSWKQQHTVKATQGASLDPQGQVTFRCMIEGYLYFDGAIVFLYGEGTTFAEAVTDAISVEPKDKT